MLARRAIQHDKVTLICSPCVGIRPLVASASHPEKKMEIDKRLFAIEKKMEGRRAKMLL